MDSILHFDSAGSNANRCISILYAPTSVSAFKCSACTYVSPKWQQCFHGFLGGGGHGRDHHDEDDYVATVAAAPFIRSLFCRFCDTTLNQQNDTSITNMRSTIRRQRFNASKCPI